MAWCKTNTISDFFVWNFFSFKNAWIFACTFQFSSKTLPCILFGHFALCFWEKRGPNIKVCTMNAMRRTRENHSLKFLAPLLVWWRGALCLNEKNEDKRRTNRGKKTIGKIQYLNRHSKKNYPPRTRAFVLPVVNFYLTSSGWRYVLQTKDTTQGP